MSAKAKGYDPKERVKELVRQQEKILKDVKKTLEAIDAATSETKRTKKNS